MRAQARQSVDEIELRQRRTVPAVDPRMGLIEAAPGEGGDPDVQRLQSPLIPSRPGGGVEGEGQGRCANEQGGVGACADVAGGGGQPGVCHLPATEPGDRAFEVKHSHPDSALAQ